MQRRIWTIAAALIVVAPLTASLAQSPEPRFTSEPPFRLAVGGIDIVETTRPSSGPARALEAWARARLVATGGPDRLIVTILRARLTDTPLRLQAGSLTDAATDQQSDRLDAVAEVRLDIVDPSGGTVATARAIATRYQTVMESTPPDERDDIADDMTRRLIAELSPTLDREIRAHFAPYLR